MEGRRQRGKGKPNRHGQRGQVTKARVLAAARFAFGRLGYDRCTNKDIAEVAEVSPGLIYTYFGSKPELFVAVGTQIWRELRARIQERLRVEQGFANQFGGILDEWGSFIEEDPSIAQIGSTWIQELQRHPELQALVPATAEVRVPHAFYERLAREAKEAGTIPKEVNEEIIAHMLIALCFGLSILFDPKHVEVHRQSVEAAKDVIAAMEKHSQQK